MSAFRRLCATVDGTSGRKVVEAHGKSFEQVMGRVRGELGGERAQGVEGGRAERGQ
jgi:hypothetical protein